MADILVLASSLLDKVLSVDGFLTSVVGIGFQDEDGAPSNARRLDSPPLKVALYRCRKL